MRKKFFLAIFLLYVSILTISNVHALEDGVTIPLVADRISDNGEVGSYLNAQVIVTNGTGHVFVDTNPYTQVDLQGSARIAAIVASDVLGIDESKYDFYYIIEIDSPIIGGPSAGGALTVATIAAIKKWAIKPGIVMTGMIDPDETIGPVGGIPFKLKAAADKNTTMFLVPQGQLIVTTINFSTNNIPLIEGHTTETVDLTQLGDKLNVTVKEVSTIQEAVLAFTGHDINKPSINKTLYTSNYLNLLQPLALQLRNVSANMYNNSKSINSDLIKNSADLRNQADVLVNNKKYYAATSLYFQSMVDILNAQWQYQYNQEANKEQYVKDLTKTVEKQIQSSENDLDMFKSNGITDVDVIGAAESRIMEANNTLENVENLNNTEDIITALAFANERAKSAQWWLTLAVPSGKVIPEDILKERSGWYLSQALSISTYVQSLLSESGHSGLSLGDTTIAQKEIDRGYYSGSIFDSLQIIARLGTGIELSGLQDPALRINQSAMAAETTINEVRSEGIEPTLAVSAYEYGGILTNPYEQITQYSYAKMIAKTTESLYTHALSNNKTPIKPVITISNNVPNVTTVPTQKTPAFEAIFSVVIILIISQFKFKFLYKSQSTKADKHMSRKSLNIRMKGKGE
jgi:uncharacterized protein